MRVFVCRVLYVAALMALGACRGAPVEAGDPQLVLTPAGTTFARGPGGWASAGMALEHRGGRAVGLTGCPEPVAGELERREGGAWRGVDRFALLCLAIYGPTTVTLRAGQTFRFAVPVREAGRYRVLAHIGPTWGSPEFKVPSAEFTVE